MGGKTLTYAASVAFGVGDENAVGTEGEGYVLVALLVLGVMVEDLVEAEAVVELGMENELLEILSLDEDWFDVDLVVDEVKSCCDCCEGFGLVSKVDEHSKPLRQLVMELSLYYEEMLEVHVVAVVAAAAVAYAVAEVVVALHS